MKRKIIGMKLKAKNLIISISQFRKFHLMDAVIYKGKKCFINNGTSCDNNGVQMWDILETQFNSDGKRNAYYVYDKDIKKALSIHNIKNGLFDHYNWWKLYWYNIELNKALER